MRTRLENDERIGVNSHPSCGARVLAEQPWSPDILWVRSRCHYGGGIAQARLKLHVTTVFFLIPLQYITATLV
jgi:hypothetical protein